MSDINTNSLLTGATFFKGFNSYEKNFEHLEKIYQSIRSSFGPLGLDKMCVSASGDVLITNDGATILKNMVVNDPCANLLVNLALEQDKEVGDGTTTVVLLAYFLIKRGLGLIKKDIHPSIVISGYKMAFNQAIKYIKENMALNIEEIDENIKENIIKTSISSKIINEESSLFIKILKDVFKHKNSQYVISKSIGKSLKDSCFYRGFILNCSLVSNLMVREKSNSSLLLLDFSLLKVKMPLCVNISSDPDQLEKIRQKEIDLTKEKVLAIIKTGVDLILMTGGLDEMCIKMFIDKGISVVRRVKLEDLQNISKSLNCPLYSSIYSLSNEIDLVPVKIRGFSVKTFNEYNLVHLDIDINTILVRGPNEQICDEVERSLNDAIQVLKRTMSKKSVLPGGGSVECSLSLRLEEYASSINLKEHTAIFQYSECLLDLAKLLCTNANLDPNESMDRLFSMQREALKSKEKVFLGVDVVSGTIQDNIKHGIVEPTVYKLKALKSATEAAISILRINETIIFPDKDEINKLNN